MGCRKRIRHAKLRQDYKGAVNCCPEPENVSMPKQGSTLASDGEVVHITLTWWDWALGDVCRPVRPPGSELPNSVPEFQINKSVVFSKCEDGQNKSVQSE